LAKDTQGDVQEEKYICSGVKGSIVSWSGSKVLNSSATSGIEISEANKRASAFPNADASRGEKLNQTLPLRIVGARHAVPLLILIQLS
jgi:hypothetical protein